MPMLSSVRAWLLAALTLLVVAAPAAAEPSMRVVGARPLSDRAAARQVHRDGEARPENFAANHHVPSRAQLRAFHRRSDMPYERYITGRFRGTTDEILQWAAAKWGIDPELLRAVAVVESWWKQSTVGDQGSSFGLMQVRVPYHCCLPYIQTSTAFNVDYYAGELRAAYDGRLAFLNQVEHGREYRSGDLWGSVGEWASGRWHLGTSDSYVGMVQQRLGERTWSTSWFLSGR